MEDMNNKKLIRLSKSCISDSDKKAVNEVLDREYLGMGRDVEQFEDDLSVFFSRPAVCVVNGTAALHLTLQACGIGLGDEVLLPSLTYISSFQSISATGAKPVACDINSENFLLDLSDAEKRITTKTRAVMPVHYSGGVGDLEEVYVFGKRHGIRVIEDAAHAFGTTYKNKRIGSIGDVACFSFDGIKNITSGEGGCIVTDNKDLLRNVRDARLQGVEKDTKKRYAGERSWDFDVTQQGWRYHMSNIMAALGIEQLKRFHEFAEKRQQICNHYEQMFANHPLIHAIKRDYEKVVPHIFVVRIDGMKNRKGIQQKMLEKGIQVGYHYQPNHWLSYYKDQNEDPLPITEKYFPELLTLPLHPDLSFSEIKYVSENLIKLID